VLALKGAEEGVKQKIFKNMSQRASAMLQEELENKGPVRLSEVESAQKEILATARRLADEGQIVLGSAGGEQMV
jgi:flagellar motor switch protein FliG